jgi:hypothetical protein
MMYATMQRPMPPTTAQIQRGDGALIPERRLVDLPGEATGEPFAEIGNRKMAQSIGRPVINIDHPEKNQRRTHRPACADGLQNYPHRLQEMRW